MVQAGVLLGLFLAASAGVAAAKAQDEMTIRIGFMPVEDELPLYLAAEEGRFAKAGIKVELVTFASAIERDTALRAGQLDGIVTDLVAAVLLRKSDLDVVVTSITLGATPQEGRFAILAAPNSGIRSVEDLRNVPIGISGNTIIEFVTDQLLREKGLKPAEIKKVEVAKIPLRLEMLLSGQLKAAALPDPIAAAAEVRGARVIASDTESRHNLSPIVYLWQRSSLERKKEAFRRFYQVYREAVKAINADPERYRPLLIKNAQVPEQIARVYPIPHFPQPTLPRKEDYDLVVRWLLEKMLIAHGPEYETLFDNRFVE